MREVAMLIDIDGRVIWTDTDDNPGYLSDKVDRWSAIWKHREHLAVIAHSHPCGPHGFSSTDITSFNAIMLGLGGVMHFAVVSPEGTVLLRRGQGWEDSPPLRMPIALEPAWAQTLRQMSGMMPFENEERLRSKISTLELLLSQQDAELRRRRCIEDDYNKISHGRL